MQTQKYSVNQHLIETLLVWVKSGEIAIPMDVDVIEELDDKFETLFVIISLGQQQCMKQI